MTYNCTASVSRNRATANRRGIVRRAYQHDTLGRPTSRTLARQGATRNDVFNYNNRSESPRRLVGGLDKPRSAFAPQGRAGNGVPASQLISDVVDVTGFNGWDYDRAAATSSSGVANRPVLFTKDDNSVSVACTYDYMGRRATKVVTENGYIGTAYTYTAYGQVTASGSITQPIQWSSEYNDTKLGLVYYNYLHYNSTDGRWVGRDIMLEQASYLLYTYYRNNTIQQTGYIDLISKYEKRPCMEKLSKNYLGNAM